MERQNFKGNFAACLNHLVQLLTERGESKNQLKRLIAKTCGISEFVVGTWLDGKHRPDGLNMIKMQHVLNLLGYELEEFEEIVPEAMKLGQIITFRIISFVKAMNLLRISKRETLFLNLKGRRNPRAEAREKMQEIVDEYGDLLLTAVGYFQIFETPDVFDDLQDSKAAQKKEEDHQLKLKRLAELILEINPLAKEILSDEYTPQERRMLRELTGDDGVHIATNHLRRLMSEASREETPVLKNRVSR